VRYKSQGPLTELARRICGLSRVCRQTHHESTSFLDSYTEVKITTYCIMCSRWEVVFRWLSFKGVTFDAVLSLELPKDLVVDMVGVYRWRETYREYKCLTRFSAQRFPSLEVVMLPATLAAEPLYKDAIRWVFRKRELRIEQHK